jgi:hypothetical protein
MKARADNSRQIPNFFWSLVFVIPLQWARYSLLFNWRVKSGSWRNIWRRWE